jgi:hypothetical protein
MRKYSKEIAGPVFIKVAPEQDHMPVQVAIEMLCAPKARLTNRQRKTCQAARQKVFESTLHRGAVEDAIAHKLKGKTWAQLIRWNKRCSERRMTLQRLWEKAREKRSELAAQEVDPKDERAVFTNQSSPVLLDRTIAALELKVEQLTQLWDALDDEMRVRKSSF